jgi:hypothetical protein
MDFHDFDNHDSNREVRNIGGRPQLPPTAGRICRVAAGLATWTPEEKAYLKEHPRLIAYHDQLQAALHEVRDEPKSECDFTDEALPPFAAGPSRA